MHIDSLHLTNFRNFTDFKINLDPKLTVILGPNGSGKSNILEALGLLAVIRPKRVETDLDLVRFGQSEAKIEGTVSSGENEKVTLTINFQVVDETYIKKAGFIDGIKKRLMDFIGYFSMVSFEPTDLDLVNGSPSQRRHHLDTFLESLDRTYWRNLKAYNKVVTRRNKVLQRIQEARSKQNELDFWDERLLEHGQYISGKRQEFFEFLNHLNTQGLNPSEGSTLKELKEFSWYLKQSLLSVDKLTRNRGRDILAGMTLSGPHRDDFQFLFQDSGNHGRESVDEAIQSSRSEHEAKEKPQTSVSGSLLKEKNLEFFGSRGEQRMAVLALKLDELEYLTRARLMRPTLALDDIFSELDWDHRQVVLSIIDKQQTIITAAERESLPKEIFKRAKIIQLK